jgi:TfoX N-terminal domain
MRAYGSAMAFDPELADRIRELLADRRDVRETRMFGGLAFLVGGHMAIAASREGGVLVRVAPGETDRWVAGTAAEIAVMRGRPMDGWLRVAAEHLVTEEQLAAWVEAGVGFTSRLPPKSPATRQRQAGPTQHRD